ncbi:MAG: dihydrolipoyllysine-residue succinyltransferase [Candidatus Marinimicrobia bacterium]|nr:dihydrolipoyllysine-residue succinyltransferase [Candidatus Neomarinimicrobiota bacterium]RPG04857.1 MAG: 2-oxoglutarate dehydrogenase complex dihydrolipoyllysine-residue succinyltransferase [Pelagibacteraceae bacterium TMED247]|tara:strand:- start:17369 stop:18679 length:1311 start_codon:yes stop_codon:yes gene_type:complete
MSEKIVVPTLGESVTEATVSKWLKSVGDNVDSDEPLVELETDKVNVEVPSPLSGVLEKINVKEGQTVEVGGLLGSVNANSEELSEKPKEQIKKYTPPPKKEVPLFEKPIEEKKKTLLNNGAKPLILEDSKEEQPLVLDEEYTQTNLEKPKIEKHASPSARKLAKEQKINLSSIEGTGIRGTVLKEDLINLMGSKPSPNKRIETHGEEERVKMTRLRLTIAKRLKEAQNNAAMLTTFNEVDMSEIMQMRKTHQSEFQKKYGVKLGFMSFFVKSCISALKNYPAVNAEIQNEEIIYKNYYNISFAVGTDRGLVVPVLRNSDRMSFADIEKNISSLGDKARNGKITIEDLQGGTFTITNGGIYGSMLSTPILNPPQSGVLGMHNIIERAVVKDGNIVIRPTMYLALSYDHRIIDGKEAVSFLKNVKDFLEDPKRLFLNI